MKTSSNAQTVKFQAFGLVAVVMGVAAMVITGSGEQFLAAMAGATHQVLAVKFH